MYAWWLWAELCGFCTYGNAGVLAAAAISAHADEVRTFDIPPQSLDAAFVVFLEQAGLGSIVTGAKLSGLQTRGVRGTMTVREALEQLFAGTPVKPVEKGDGFELTRRDDAGAAVTLPKNPPRFGSGSARAPARERSNPVWLSEPEYLDRHGMTVTGSHIPRPAGPLSPPVLELDRNKLERVGIAQVPELADTVPQNFGGGPTEDTIRGIEAETNSARGFGFNLRGLGAGNTLVLLNGRRLAAGGSEGSFVDAANLALSAVDHVEIMAAAASPLYGSDAVGGVVNLVTRHDPGIETVVRTGGATDGGLAEYQLAQRFGVPWDGGSAVLSFELFDRDRLRAGDRELARSDLRPFGGDNFDTVNGNPGTLVDGGIPYAIPGGQDGRSLDVGDLAAGTANLYDLRAGSDLLPEQRRVSGLLSLRHELSELVSLYSDVTVARRNVVAEAPGVRAALTVPDSNPYFVSPGGNPAVVVNYDLGRDLGPTQQAVTVDFANAAAGAHVQFGRGWLLNTYVGYGMESQDQVRSNVVDFESLALFLSDPNEETAFNPFGDGSHTPISTIEAIRASQTLATRSRIGTIHVGGDGPVAALPGGDAMLALGAEYRAQEFRSGNELLSSRGATSLGNEFEREVASVFAELRVPLFGGSNARRGLHEMEMSFAARYEHYDDFGDKAVPGIGLSWSPVPGLKLRTSWAESFKAPNLADLDQTSNLSQLFPLVDPQDPQAGAVPFLLSIGKNADLQEETARNWTAGIDLTPAWEPNLALSLTWFHVDLFNRVQEIVSAFPNLADPRIAPFIDRDPTAEEREAICGRSTFAGTLADCLDAPIAGIADLRIQNGTRTRTSGIDARLNYARHIGMHDLELDVLATYVSNFELAFGDDQPVELVDTQTNPLDFRLRGTLAWEYQGWGATLAMNYADAYRDVLSEPARRIDSLTTFDAQVRYELPEESGWLGGLRASITVRNVFDEQAPFFNNPQGIGYDQENAELNGRTVRLTLGKKW
ncbi:MAG TPA: TonB-dependent receptor [Steroidobacteraceae bacterium]|nr:TonB-dependent receptor [Steroidobacteraceae bacterium]